MLLDLLDRDLRVVLLTARPERVHPLTEAWLEHYAIRWDLLSCGRGATTTCRRDSSSRRCGISRRTGSTFVSRIEDDRRNVEMFRAQGIPCLYMHSGYYD